MHSLNANEVIPLDIIKNGASLLVANELDIKDAAKENLNFLLQQNPNLSKSTSEYLVEFYQRKAETLQNVWATIRGSPLAIGIREIKPETITASAGSQLKALSSAVGGVLGTWGQVGDQVVRDLSAATSSLPSSIPDVNDAITTIPDVAAVITSSIPDVAAAGKDILESSVSISSPLFFRHLKNKLKIY
jgi:hypothetical protein